MATNGNRGGGGGGRGGRAAYDPSLDKVFATYKARDEKLGEGVVVQLVSYNGNEPRVKVTRYYRDDKKGGKWFPDTQRVFPRFRIVVLSWLLSAAREIDKGHDVWEREKNPRGGRR